MVTETDWLRARLDAFPRVSLAELATPLEPLPGLSEEVGRTIYCKRDDLAGGNKIRNLEFLLADARRRNARKIVTFGGLQSNHARLTAETARQLELEAHVIYFECRPAFLQGNALAARELGATLHFVPFGRTQRPTLTVTAANRLTHLVALALVGRHTFVPVGGSSWRGCLGYVGGALELDEQARAAGLGPVRVVLPVGTGGTLAGLLAGFALAGSPLRPLGIDVGNLWRRFPASIASLATEVTARLGGQRRFRPPDVPLIERTYVGGGYAQPSERAAEAARVAARLDGLALDPVYTAKAFAGLLDLAGRGGLPAGEPIVFLHTGGLQDAPV